MPAASSSVLGSGTAAGGSGSAASMASRAARSACDRWSDVARASSAREVRRRAVGIATSRSSDLVQRRRRAWDDSGRTGSGRGSASRAGSRPSGPSPPGSVLDALPDRRSDRRRHGRMEHRGPDARARPRYLDHSLNGRSRRLDGVIAVAGSQPPPARTPTRSLSRRASQARAGQPARCRDPRRPSHDSLHRHPPTAKERDMWRWTRPIPGPASRSLMSLSDTTRSND